MSQLRRYLTFAFILVLCGCSQKASSIVDTFKSALVDGQDVHLTASKVGAIPYASIYAQVGDGPRVFMVLGFVENQRLKWFSADSRMIVTQFGRVIKTIGLPIINLDALTSYAPDPLSLGSHSVRTGAAWAWMSDLSPGYNYGLKFQGSFVFEAKEELSILGQKRSVDRYQERVVDATGEPFSNLFWLDSDTGDVVKSRQRFGAGLPVIEITQLKRFEP
jgi:hypothetical protein